MNNRIYAIYDKVAQTLTGPLMQFRADAAAVRVFNDLATDPKTQIAQHPADYDLLKLGELVDETTIFPETETILEGSTWLALNQKTPHLE